MNSLDVLILSIVSLLGLVFCACGLFVGILWLCRYIYRNVVGWPVIWKGLTRLKQLENDNQNLRGALTAATLGKAQCTECGKNVLNAWRDSDGYHCLTCLAHERDRLRKRGVLETILREIQQHDKDHPDHGVGCACHDQHASKIRALLQGVEFKSRENFFTVLGYVMRNP